MVKPRPLKRTRLRGGAFFGRTRRLSAVTLLAAETVFSGRPCSVTESMNGRWPLAW